MHYIYENFEREMCLIVKICHCKKNTKTKQNTVVLKRCFIQNITSFYFLSLGRNAFLWDSANAYWKTTWVYHYMDFTCAKCVFLMWPCVFAHVKAGLFSRKMLIFPHCFLTWLECVFGMDHKCLRQSSSFAQSEPVSPVGQVLLWADLWHNRGGRSGPSGLTQERQTPRRSPLGQLLLFCLLLAPQLLIDDNLDIVLRGTHQSFKKIYILHIIILICVYVLVDSNSFNLKRSSMTAH